MKEGRVYMGYGFKVIAEGPYACFTRPEMKVERVSYDVPTPGALEGMLKSVYWKPSIRYVIDRVVVFNPIDFISIRRNEVKEKVLFSAVKGQMEGRDGADPRVYTDEDIERLELILNLTRNLGVNLAGVEVVMNLRDRMEKMQAEMQRVVEHYEHQLRNAGVAVERPVPEPASAHPTGLVKLPSHGVRKHS